MLTLSTGIGHDLASLARIERLPGIRSGLGGHEGEIADVPARAAALRRLVEERLETVLELCAEPRTIADVSRRIFGQVRSYHVLLALLEAGALVEHLEQHGELVVAGVEEIEAGAGPVVFYVRAG